MKLECDRFYSRPSPYVVKFNSDFGEWDSIFTTIIKSISSNLKHLKEYNLLIYSNPNIFQLSEFSYDHEHCTYGIFRKASYSHFVIFCIFNLKFIE